MCVSLCHANRIYKKEQDSVVSASHNVAFILFTVCYDLTYRRGSGKSKQSRCFCSSSLESRCLEKTAQERKKERKKNVPYIHPQNSFLQKDGGTNLTL